MGLWVDPSRRREWIALLASQDGPVRAFDVKLRSASGEVRAFELSGSRVAIAGEACMVTVARDVTDRKRHERLLHEAAQGVNAETGEPYFRSLVAHLARVLEADIALVGELDPERAGYVRTVA